MYIKRNGEKVDTLPTLEDYVEIKGKEKGVVEYYRVYILKEKDFTLIGEEPFETYPTTEQIKWCLYKYQPDDGSRIFAKVSKQYGLGPINADMAKKIKETVEKSSLKESIRKLGEFATWGIEPKEHESKLVYPPKKE